MILREMSRRRSGDWTSPRFWVMSSRSAAPRTTALRKSALLAEKCFALLFLKSRLGFMRPNWPNHIEQKTTKGPAMEKPTSIIQRTHRLHKTIVPGFAATAVALVTLASSPAAWPEDGSAPALPSPQCDSLVVPAGNTIKFHAYAVGVQIYHWDGAAWVFDAPAATLFADSGDHAQVGIHYAGPTWETQSGSKVVGARLAACTPDSTAIPWLKLGAVSSEGPGVFEGVTYIQRVNTSGGKAPGTPGTSIGQQANVPYSAEYYFYESDGTEP
jgi:hypothetical protein